MFSRIPVMLLLALGLSAAARAEETRPLKVLWATGGGFHDYRKLTPLLTEAIQKHANVRFDVISDYKTLAEKGFADRYDAVVYFFSYHDQSAKPVVDNIAATIHDGKPAMFIHGTLHSFRELEQDRRSFCKAIGLTSVAHDPLRPLATKKVADHPVIRDWPDDWKTPGDELYQNVKVWPGATPLLTALSETSKQDQVVAWVNQHGRGKVFGTSLGHDTKTAGNEAYQKLLANGLLWICGKLDASGKPTPGYAGSEAGK